MKPGLGQKQYSLRGALPGMVCTSSRIIRPHSWLFNHSITLSASHDLFVVCPNMEYVLIAIEQPIGLSLASEVNRQIWLSSMVDHILNWAFHCSTETAELPNTKHRLRTVQAAVTPTSDLPAPVVNETKIYQTLHGMYYYPEKK